MLLRDPFHSLLKDLTLFPEPRSSGSIYFLYWKNPHVKEIKYYLKWPTSHSRCTAVRVPGPWGGWRRLVGAHPWHVVGMVGSGEGLFSWLLWLSWLWSCSLEISMNPSFATPFIMYELASIWVYGFLFLVQNKNWLSLPSKPVTFYPGSCHLLCLVGWTLHWQLLLHLWDFSPNSLLIFQLTNMPKSIIKHKARTWKVLLIPVHLFLTLSLTFSSLHKVPDCATDLCLRDQGMPEMQPVQLVWETDGLCHSPYMLSLSKSHVLNF